jgi:retinol dehydrogenase-12
MDLASFGSIRNGIQEFLDEHGELHVLVNNAGVWTRKRELSADGIELTWAVNHLAPFLLTNLLLKTMKKSAPARIINVSSNLHRRGEMYWDDLEGARDFKGSRAYAQSKLANVMFTRALTSRLEESDVTANSLHPGVVATNLLRNYPAPLQSLAKLVLISSEKGAATSVYLSDALAVAGVSGKYFVNSRASTPSTLALDDELCEKLWQVSEEKTANVKQRRRTRKVAKAK